MMFRSFCMKKFSQLDLNEFELNTPATESHITICINIIDILPNPDHILHFLVLQPHFSSVCHGIVLLFELSIRFKLSHKSNLGFSYVLTSFPKLQASSEYFMEEFRNFAQEMPK